MFDVVIVEDDPMVAMLHRKFVEADGRFQVAAEFPSGLEALRWFLRNQADLLILDVYMPILNGAELLRELRARGCGIDVIMVTAAHDTQTLDELLKLGVVDYLMKPFTSKRFHQAMDTFCRNRAALLKQCRVSQSDIDRLIHTPPAEREIPKGLQQKTLRLVLDELHKSCGERTCEELAAGTGLSVVTIRRYLNYLSERGEVESRVNYDTGGRPSLVYWADTT